MNFFTLWIFISLTSFTHCLERMECRWSGQYLCGDKCVELDRDCYCGSQSFNFSDTFVYSCCNEGPCFEDSFQDVHCNGTRNVFLHSLCNGECAQMPRYGYTYLPCKHETQCYLVLVHVKVYLSVICKYILGPL